MVDNQNSMDVKGFFDTDTNTISYVVTDKKTAICAVIDSVLDLDYASGNIKYENVDKIVKEAINFFLKEPDLEDFKKAIKKVNTIKH